MRRHGSRGIGAAAGRVDRRRGSWQPRIGGQHGLALRAHEWRLRPLVVHLDVGWNSEIAVQNVQGLVEACGYELHTQIIDWDVVRRLQLAYLRSGVSNQDVPQDHAFQAALYRCARENRVSCVLRGNSFATECVAVNWHGPALDARNLRAIFAAHGEGTLDGFPLITFTEYYVTMPIVHRLRTVAPLDCVPYSREEAIAELSAKVGWRTYGRKHGESLWTRFFQNHYLPTRLGMDKRRPHYSGQIISGQLSRDEALRLMEEPLYDPAELARDRAYVLKKCESAKSKSSGMSS